jgi:hypothetical protein
MNKSLRFGYDSIGAYTIIKLNVKLSDGQMKVMDNNYHQWIKFWNNRTRKCNKITRIEGVLPHDCVSDFVKALKIAVLQSQIEFKMDELQGLINPIVSSDLDWTQADLDNI